MTAQRVARPQSQRGVVLFVALIAMVVLSLAGVALIRAVDTSGSAAGNIAFREASVTAVNRAIEQAVNRLFVSKVIFPETDVDVVNNYYGKLQLLEHPNGVPDALSGTYTTMKGVYPFGAADVYPTSTAEVRSVIERICSNAAPPAPLTFLQRTQYCDMQPPKLPPAKTSMKLKGVELSPIPLYRVTVRVDLPGTNTSTYAQAMLH